MPKGDGYCLEDGGTPGTDHIMKATAFESSLKYSWVTSFSVGALEQEAKLISFLYRSIELFLQNKFSIKFCCSLCLIEAISVT